MSDEANSKTAATDEASESERRIAMLREGTEAYNRGDLGWLYERAAEDIEVMTEAQINSANFRGKDRFRTWMEGWQEAWSQMTIEILTVEAFDDRFLLVAVSQTGVGSISGVETTQKLVQLLEIADERIARFHLYETREQALAAVDRLRA